MSSLFFTLVLLGTSAVMGFMYISPTISQIRENQDTTKLYSLEAGRVETVVQELSNKVAFINNSISLSKQVKLSEYLPNTIDEIYVLKVLEKLTANVQNITLTEMSIGDVGAIQGQEQLQSNLLSSSVSLSITAPYQNLLEFFDILHRNNFPFVIQNVEISQNDKNDYEVQLELAVFALPAQVTFNSDESIEVTSDLE